jgi:AAA15 family ATPase/GTPase
MIDEIEIKNFGPLRDIQWQNLGKINLIIGGNGSGKTFLLKALYVSVRTIEEFKRGDDPRSISDILLDKLYWTFQPEKIGDLVSKNASSPLFCKIVIDDKYFSYHFGDRTMREISSPELTIPPRNSNSIFLPAKEVLSLYHIILKSREQDKVFGFDDTYYDLARALRQSTRRGNNYHEFSESRKKLRSIINGRIEFDESLNRWLFKNNNVKFPIGVTAEGIKKIAILDTLLGNDYLDPNSFVFIDEPEAALHPQAISQLLEIISTLSKCGIQFFLASHSYFVIKKLFLIAQQNNESIPILCVDGNQWTTKNLIDGIPENSIINESIALYEKEVDLSFK